MEPAIAIADALVEQLNEHAFAFPFTAERRYLSRPDLATSSALAVTVMLIDLESTMSTRAADDETHTVAVCVHQRVGNTLPETIDPLVNLVRQIHDFCRARTLASAKVIRRQMRPRYDLEALAKTKEFVAFLFVECKLIYEPGGTP